MTQSKDSSVQFSSVTQSCPTLCDPMNRSTPGLPVHHQLPEFTQIHIHWVSDAIQPSHPLSSPSPVKFVSLYILIWVLGLDGKDTFQCSLWSKTKRHLGVGNHHMGLHWWLSDKESTCQCRRHRFNPWVRKIPWRRKWQPTQAVLPGKSHGQGSLVISSPGSHRRVGHGLATKQQWQNTIRRDFWTAALSPNLISSLHT